MSERHDIGTVESATSQPAGGGTGRRTPAVNADGLKFKERTRQESVQSAAEGAGRPVLDVMASIAPVMVTVPAPVMINPLFYSQAFAL
jgi:hypothetical protein